MSPLNGFAAMKRGSFLPEPLPAAEERIKILMVDDTPANLLALESMLERAEYDLVRANSGEDALRKMLSHRFALVLLDVLMPGMDGFDTAALMRKRMESKDTPIIFLTAGTLDENHVSRGYSLGAVDYLYKPIVPEFLKAKVQVFTDLYRKSERLARSEEALRAQLEEFRKEQTARRDSEEMYRELFSRATDAILVYDARTGAVLDGNRAALKLYGYNRVELKKLKASDLGDDHAAKRSDGLQKRKDGSMFPAEVTHGEFTLDGRRLIMALARDLTERRKAEEAERLRERDIMQRRLVSTVSHELRTPIAAIKGFAETLRRGGVEDSKNRLGFIRIIENHADRLGWLVEDLLALAELESGKGQPKPAALNFSDIASEFIGSIEPIATRRSVTISLDCEPGVVLWMDPSHMTQVLQNLLDNAIKYNRKGGKVTVTARALKGGKAQVTVADTGIGVSPADLPLIFEQFHRTEVARAHEIKGTGLGLYIIKTIVEANGGKIWAESVKDEGSSFHFTVPLATAT